MLCVVLGLHLLGWILLIVAAGHAGISRGMDAAFGLGIGVAAYLLGLRHAFDVDHIAAIDSTTRKLLGEGVRTRTVGFWFSLGHSTVVFLLCAALAAGARLVGDLVGSTNGGLRDSLALFGTTVSGAFLCGLGVLNLALLTRLVRDFGLRGSERPESDGQPAGLLGHALRPLMRLVTRPWQMYVVGLLFGLGFDTASEVALLVVAGGAATAAVPWYAILALPLLFAAGMSLLDTLDGWFMSVAYDWTFQRPRLRLIYNSALTAVSAAVALTIGAVELASVPVVAGRQSVDLGELGYIVVAVFITIWIVAVLVTRRSVTPMRPSSSPAAVPKLPLEHA